MAAKTKTVSSRLKRREWRDPRGVACAGRNSSHWSAGWRSTCLGRALMICTPDLQTPQYPYRSGAGQAHYAAPAVQLQILRLQRRGAAVNFSAAPDFFQVLHESLQHLSALVLGKFLLDLGQGKMHDLRELQPSPYAPVWG